MRVISGLFIFMCLALNTLSAAEVTTNKSTYIPGEIVTVTFAGSTFAKDWVGVYDSTTTPATLNNLDWFYINGTKSVPSAVVGTGTLQFTAPSNPGNYKFCFHPNDVYTVDAVTNFSVEQPPALKTDKSTYSSGETVTVTFTGAKRTNDWVGMYNSATTPARRNNLSWLYLDGTSTTPSAVETSGKLQFTAPATAGDYKFCFHPNDAYTVDTVVNFSVQKKIIQAPQFTSTMTSLLEGSATHFIDLSRNKPTAWAWTFEGGTPATSSTQNPTVNYANAGTYNVTLTTTNAAGNHTTTKTGYITVAKKGEATHLKCLQFNIWQEGTSVTNGVTYIRDVVAAVNPDVVSFVEVRNYNGDWTTKMVNALAELGLTYHRGYATGDTSIISKFPIKSSTQVSTTVVSNIDVYGTEVLVASAHLDYTYYACYLPRGFGCLGSSPYNHWNAVTGGPVTDTATIRGQNLGSKRDEEIAAFINYVKDEKRPTILLGDFNEPSHLDWTAKQANMFDHNGVVYQWDTTLSLANNNFTDAFRKVYPDEVANPGISWPALAEGKPSIGWIKADERDRIDFIFYRGTGINVTDAAVVGPQACFVNSVKSLANTENDKFLVPDLPWPSDHKGVWANILIPGTAKKIEVIPTSEETSISPEKANSEYKIEAIAPSRFIKDSVPVISKKPITIVELTKGWNLVGPTSTCQAPSGFQVYAWKNSTYTPLVQNNPMIPGHGYWLFSDEDASINLK